MFDVFAKFATDPTAEEKGRGFKKEFGGGATFYIARAGNRNYSEQLQLEYKAHEYTLDQGNKPDATEADKKAAADLSFKLVGRVMARTILLGWDTHEMKDGVEVTHANQVAYNKEVLGWSPENAEKLLSHSEFRDRVFAISNNYEKFLVAQEEADAKNSVTTSPGTSSGVTASNS